MAKLEVLLASSSDSQHPTDAIVDGKPDTFWATTGLFPQEVIFGIPAHVTVSSLTMKTAGGNLYQISLHCSNQNKFVFSYKSVSERKSLWGQVL